MNTVNIIGTKMRVLYESGATTKEVAATFGTSYITARRWMLASGVTFRNISEALKSSKFDRKSHFDRVRVRKHTDASKKKMSDSKRSIADYTAKGTRITSQGYEEYTRGQHKGRHVHTVIIENMIGRRITKDESVHHKDHNKLNNHINNLQLIGRSDHSKYHRSINKHLYKKDNKGKYTTH